MSKNAMWLGWGIEDIGSLRLDTSWFRLIRLNQAAKGVEEMTVKRKDPIFCGWKWLVLLGKKGASPTLSKLTFSNWNIIMRLKTSSIFWMFQCHVGGNQRVGHPNIDQG